MVCAAGPARIHGQTVSMSLVAPNVRVNRHFAAGRVWARIFEPKLGPPQSVRLNDQLGSTAPAVNEPTVRYEGDVNTMAEIFAAHDFREIPVR